LNRKKLNKEIRGRKTPGTHRDDASPTPNKESGAKRGTFASRKGLERKDSIASNEVQKSGDFGRGKRGRRSKNPKRS